LFLINGAGARGKKAPASPYAVAQKPRSPGFCVRSHFGHYFPLTYAGAAQPQSPGDKRWASETVGGKGSRRHNVPGGSPSCCGAIPMSPRRPSSGSMLQIKIRWGDLGSPVEPGSYRFGPHIVEVMPGDIRLAKGNPDAVFTAIRPNFYPDAAPYLLTGVELPPANPEVERGSGDRLPKGPEQALAKNSSDQALAVEKPRSSGQTSLKEGPSTATTTDIIAELNRIWDDPRPDHEQTRRNRQPLVK
jgi:hypothetical protein